MKKQVLRADVVNPENPQFVEEDFLIQPVFDDDGVQVSSAIGRDGKEYPDPVPMAPPVGFDSPPDLMQIIRRMVQSERYQAEMAAGGFETFDEAEDMDIPEDEAEFGPTPYEAVFDPLTGLPVDRPQGAPAAPPSSSGPPSAESGGASGGVTNTPPAQTPKVENSKSSTST